MKTQKSPISFRSKSKVSYSFKLIHKGVQESHTQLTEEDDDDFRKLLTYFKKKKTDHFLVEKESRLIVLSVSF